MEFLHDMELNSPPTANNHVTNKEYVDAAVAAAGSDMDYTYVDNGDANTLASANAYTDAAVAAIPVCDCEATLAAANAYTDTQIATRPDFEYVDNADADIFATATEDAHNYTDNAVANAIADCHGYTDGAVAGAIADAHAYTDAAIAALPAPCDCEAVLASANAYTDAAVAAINLTDYVTTSVFNNVTTQIVDSCIAREGYIQDLLNIEITNRTNEDANLQAQIDNINPTNFVTMDVFNNVTTQIVDSCIAREGYIQDLLNIEITNRTDGDTNLQSQIDTLNATVAAIPVCDCDAILASANAYTDAAVAAIPVCDCDATLAAANAYTDAAVAAIPVGVDQAYVDNGDANTLAAANAYTDSAIAAIPVGMDQTYVDSGDTNTLVAAQNFTNDQIMNGLFFNGLTINGLYLNGLAEANAYTDAAVAAVPVGIRKSSGTLGDGMNNTCCFTHNLGTQDVIVQVRRPAQGGTAATVVHPTIYIYDDNTVCCTFTAVPGVNGYNIVVIG